MSKNFTLVLSETEAARARELVEPFGGSVGGYAANLLRDHLWLTPEQSLTVRQQTRALAQENRKDSVPERTPFQRKGTPKK